ncbi:glycine receptor subunit alpha-3-like [Glandiceps talaboti]
MKLLGNISYTNRLFHFLIFVLLPGNISVISVQVNNTGDNEHHPDQVLNDLMKNYDKKFRPNMRGPPTNVTIDIYVSDFDSIKEATMDYGLVIFLRQRWNDNRLQFNSSETMVLQGESANLLWQPDLFLPNEKRGFLHSVTTENRLLRIYPNGDVFLSSRYSLTLSCYMDLEKFPLDDQICVMQMESYGYTTKDLVFKWSDTNPVQSEEDLKLPQFQINGYKTESCTKEYSTGAFTCILARFYLHRDVGYYMLQAYLPSILLVVLSWVSFWITYDAAPARVALGVTTILTMTTLDSGIRATLPKVAYAKAIDIWMAVCQVFVFGALVEFAVVNYVHVLRTKKRRKVLNDKYRVSVISKDNAAFEVEDKLSIEDGVHKANDKVIRRRISRLSENTIDVSENGDLTHRDIEATDFFVDAKSIDRISQVAFPTVFIIFNTIYWVMFFFFIE